MTAPTVERVAVALLVATTASCSILLGGGDDDPMAIVDAGAADAPVPPADCADATTGQAFTILEGQGASSFAGHSWDPIPRLVHVRGENLPTGDAPVFFSKVGPLDVVGGVFNGDIGVLELAFPIDRAVAQGNVDAVVFAFNNNEGTCVRVTLTATYLPEIEGAEVGAEELADLYSFISPGAASIGEPNSVVKLTSTSVIVLGGLALAGTSTGPGPGGGAGGAVQANGLFGPSGGRGAPTGLGGGGGHAFAGGMGTNNGDGAGGAPAGDITLLRSSSTDSRAGHGGGGGANRGGHGGGGLFARAEAGLLKALSVPPGASIDVSGAAADGVGGEARRGGGGSGGTIHLAAPFVDPGLKLTLNVTGGQAAAENAGSGGRIRIDAPSTGLLIIEDDTTSTFWRGAGLSRPDGISRIETVTLSLYGGFDGKMPSNLGKVEVRATSLTTGLERIVVPVTDTPTMEVSVALDPGVNIVCVETYRIMGMNAIRAIPEDAEIASNCVEIGYVP